MRLLPAVALAAAMITPAAAGTSCYVEGSAAKHVSATRASDQIDGPITIQAEGAQVGIGVGCDVESQRFLAGLLARYDLTDVSGTIGDAKIGTDNIWMVALRGGFRLSPGTLVYGLAGVAGTELSYGDLKIDPTGLVYGAGIEVDLGISNISVGLEWDHIAWDARSTPDARLQPDTDIVRLSARIRLDLFK